MAQIAHQNRDFERLTCVTTRSVTQTTLHPREGEVAHVHPSFDTVESHKLSALEVWLSTLDMEGVRSQAVARRSKIFSTIVTILQLEYRRRIGNYPHKRSCQQRVVCWCER
jgi:hypothetical protein